MGLRFRLCSYCSYYTMCRAGGRMYVVQGKHLNVVLLVVAMLRCHGHAAFLVLCLMFQAY